MPRQNTGSVFQRKDGLWTAQVTVKGKRIAQYANSQQEAETLRKQLLAGSFDRGIGIITPPVVPTLSSFLPQYLAASTNKPTTKRNFSLHLTTHALPLLGNKPLAELKPLDCAEFLSTLLKKDLTANSVAVIYRLFRTVLQKAFEWELITSNPAAKVKPPKAYAKDRTPWSISQTKQFISYCQTNPIKWEPLFLLLLSTGLRISEALGLEWLDIDFNSKTLKVQRAVVELRSGEFVTQTPKTRSSVRTISLSQQSFDALDLWQSDRAKRVGPIFRNDRKLPPGSKPLGRSLQRTCNRAGVPYIGLHGLRHQHLSLLAHAGVSVKAASVRAGHSNPNITLSIYMHVLEETDTSTVQALDKLLTV